MKLIPIIILAVISLSGKALASLENLNFYVESTVNSFSCMEKAKQNGDFEKAESANTMFKMYAFTLEELVGKRSAMSYTKSYEMKASHLVKDNECNEIYEKGKNRLIRLGKYK